MLDRNQQIDWILGLLSEVWKQYPDQRLGQLLENINLDRELFYTKDESITKYLQNVLTRGSLVE